MAGSFARCFVSAALATILSIALPARADEPAAPGAADSSAPSPGAQPPKPIDAPDAASPGAQPPAPLQPRDPRAESPGAAADVDANPPLPPQPRKPREAPVAPRPAPAPPSASGDSSWNEWPEDLRPSVATHRVWYGDQTLVVDGLSIGAVFVEPTVGLVGYLFGAPIVHAAHGHAGKPFASLALRVGMPIAGAFLGCAAAAGSGNSGGYACLGGAALGLLVGAGGAIAIDASVIAREDASERSAKRTPSVGVMPSIALTPQRARIGFAGWF
jgi:hypothetical protein